MRQIQSRVPAPRRYLDRRIVGSPEHVAAAIRRLQAQGRLVHASPWRPAPEGVTATVRILDGVPAPVERRRRWPVVVTTAVAAAGAVAGLAWAVARLVQAAIAALPVIAGGLLLLALVAALSRGGASRVACITVHGPRCRGHH